jgi:hypothetical protein
MALLLSQKKRRANPQLICKKWGGHDLGIEFSLLDSRIVNTFAAHRLLVGRNQSRAASVEAGHSSELTSLADLMFATA